MIQFDFERIVAMFKRAMIWVSEHPGGFSTLAYVYASVVGYHFLLGYHGEFDRDFLENVGPVECFTFAFANPLMLPAVMLFSLPFVMLLIRLMHGPILMLKRNLILNVLLKSTIAFIGMVGLFYVMTVIPQGFGKFQADQDISLMM